MGPAPWHVHHGPVLLTRTLTLREQWVLTLTAGQGRLGTWPQTQTLCYPARLTTPAVWAMIKKAGHDPQIGTLRLR